MISRMSSGSSRAESAVEPTRSQNMTVSWRRSADPATCEGCGVAVSVAGLPAASTPVAGSLSPHSKQNLALAGFALPQDGQRPKRAAPHSRQNLLPSGMSALQLGHRTDHPSDDAYLNILSRI